MTTYSMLNSMVPTDVLLVQVDGLAAISAATSGEVTLQHLGSRFAAAAGDYFLEGAAAQPTSTSSYDMPQF